MGHGKTVCSLQFVTRCHVVLAEEIEPWSDLLVQLLQLFTDPQQSLLLPISAFFCLCRVSVTSAPRRASCLGHTILVVANNTEIK
ncbi:hypothetical protein J6590_097618 [Homalodisca vitripennis]|nr:hypothetical protein J6590_097618 [Homalodisca vitripennis]